MINQNFDQKISQFRHNAYLYAGASFESEATLHGLMADLWQARKDGDKVAASIVAALIETV